MRERIIILYGEEFEWYDINNKLIEAGYEQRNILICNNGLALKNSEYANPSIVLLAGQRGALQTCTQVFPSVPCIVIIPERDDNIYDYITSGAADFLINNKLTGLELRDTVEKTIARSKVAAQQLEVQKNTYQNILSSITQVVWTAEVGTNQLLYINEACYDMFGYTPEEMMADAAIFFNAVHPDDKQMLMASYTDLYAQNYVEREFRVIRKDGVIKYIKSSAALKEGVNGNPGIYSGINIDLTCLRITENSLRDKIKETEDILESITDAFFTVDNDWRITHVNNKAEEIYNFKREDILNMKLWERFPVDDTSAFKTETKRAAKEKIPVNFEERSVITGKWLAVRVYPKQDGVAVYFSDISNQKKLQEKIIQDGENIKTIINNTKDIIWSFNEHMEVVLANQAYYDRLKLITGVEKVEDITEGDLNPDLLKKWQDYFRRSLNGETFKAIEKSIVAGEVVFEDISFNPIRDKEGRIKGVSCFSRDITDETKLQQKILKDDQNLKALINSSNDFIWSIDTDMRIISANQPYRDFIYATFGAFPETGSPAINPNFEDKTKEDRFAHYTKALSGTPFMVVEARIIAGNQIHRELSFNPIKGRDGEIIGVSCCARDVSAHRQQITKIKEQNQKLKEIAWIQSHHVRGPLATILGLTNLLDGDKPTNAEHVKIFEGIKESAWKLDDIIKDIVGRTYGITDIEG